MNDTKKQKALGQYFTPPSVAGLVTAGYKKRKGSVIDWAAGEGDLLLSAIEKAPELLVTAVDIDPVSANGLEEIFPGANVICRDALRLDVADADWLDRQQHDLVVGNPPFNKQKSSKFILEIIKDAFGVDYSGHHSVRSEVAFLALSLKCAKVGARVSLVLPKTFASGESWEWLRRVLVSRYRIETVITLPPSVFRNTEVETCIFTLRKATPSRGGRVRILSCNKDGNVLGMLKIAQSDGVHRFDYEYHHWKQNISLGNVETLDQAGAQVLRGNIHAKKAKELGISLFHTSDFGAADRGVIYFEEEMSINGMVSVKKDDIVMPRIGRNLNRAAIVGSGCSIISDCVFGIRVPSNRLSQVRETLESDHARSWIKIHTSGSCAKVLSKSSILRMPLL